MSSPTPPLRTSAATLALLAALSVARPAAADDPKPVVVSVTPKGQSWSIGPYGGQECDPTCTLHVVPDKYVVTVGGAKEELPIVVPTEITYSPGAPRLRTVGGWTAVGAAAVGGVLLGFGIYGYAKNCANGMGCGALDPSRTVQEVLVVSAGVLISLSVAGAIVFAVSGESIRVRDVDPAAPTARRSFDVGVNPASHGATLEFVKRF
jgi:hypothetical protein